MHTVVLGAGLAGLATAYEIAKAGRRVTILEKEDFVGGMACSWKVGPYWLDHGPHRFHSRDKRLIEHLYEILDNEVVIRERLSRIYMQGRFFHYPLKTQNLLRNMPARILLKAGFDYAWIRFQQLFKKIPDDNFENWVLKRFGRTLYEVFFGTYTSKAWKMPCTEISADWASQRISQANLWDTVKKTLNPPKDGEVRSLVSEFWYPAHGGIGQIGRKYGEKLREMGAEIHLETPCKRLEIEDGVVRRVIGDFRGEERSFECDQVVNTMPLSRALEAFEPGIDQETHTAIAALKYSSIVFVYLEVDKPSVSPDHWVYIPEKHLTIHRISEFKNFSDDAAPGQKTVVCCEMTCREGDDVWNLGLEEGARIASGDLVALGLIDPGQAHGIDIHRLKYAYPIYDLT
jgi:protoporphyrinogen oxidase